MKKFTNREIIDVVKFSDDKLIFVEKRPLPDRERYKANYYLFNFSTGEKEVITKKAYMLKKFGFAFEKICKTISNYVQCRAMILKDRSVLIIFPNGQAGLFDFEGNMIWNKELSYNEKTVCSLAADDNAFWCVCRDENCVIRYNAENFNVDIRIGSKDSSAFTSPHFVSSDDKNIYVCCNESKVRRIDKSNLSVSDVNGTFQNLRRFYKFKDFSIICTLDGAYLEKD